MEFEFDQNTSRSNKAKHGIDFIEAQALWLEELRMGIPARTEDEPRSVVVERNCRQALVRSHQLPGRPGPVDLRSTVARGGGRDL